MYDAGSLGITTLLLIAVGVNVDVVTMVTMAHSPRKRRLAFYTSLVTSVMSRSRETTLDFAHVHEHDDWRLDCDERTMDGESHTAWACFSSLLGLDSTQQCERGAELLMSG